MSDESFIYSRDMYEFSDRLEARKVWGDELRLDVADRLGKARWRRAIVELPAADARRLLAWLRERYPEETDGE